MVRDNETHTDPGLTKLARTIQRSLPSTKPKTHKKLTHCYNSSQIQHATNWETESTINEYGTWRHPIRKQGSPRKTAHSVNDLDTPIHTGTQLKKSWPSPQSMQNCVNHTWQYMIVHSDTSDLHQYSEIVSATTQCTLPSGQPTHTDPGPTKLFTDTACD